MSNSINIRHLRVFLTVAGCKSISKATNIVYLSQPAITQALAKLEASFQCALFDRRSDGMYVTESGELLMARVESALQTLSDGLRDALRVGGGESARVSQLSKLITSTQLSALVAVSAVGSYSVAGRNIGISQSSLHRSCRDLEELIGVALFEKTSIGLSPTKAALQLSKTAKLVYAEIEQGREEIFALNRREIGHMVVGSMPLARISLLPAAVIDFTTRYPDFKISINDGPYDDLMQHLRHADIDLLIGALRFPPPSDDVIQQALFSSRVVIVARPDHPYLKHSSLTLLQLENAAWVLPREGTPTRQIFDDLFSETELSGPKRIIETGSQLLIRALLEGSERLSIISEHQVQRELAEGVLSVLPFSIPHACRPIGLTYRKAWRPTKRQQAFMDILIKRGEQLDIDEL